VEQPGPFGAGLPPPREYCFADMQIPLAEKKNGGKPSQISLATLQQYIKCDADRLRVSDGRWSGQLEKPRGGRRVLSAGRSGSSTHVRGRHVRVQPPEDPPLA